MIDSHLEDIPGFNCELFSLMENVDTNNFYTEVLSRINKIIPFDIAIWGGFFQEIKEIIPFHTNNSSQSNEMFFELLSMISQSYMTEIKKNNFEKPLLLFNKERINVETIDIKKFLHDWEMEHCITIIIFHPRMDNFEAISYFRKQNTLPFSESECTFLSLTFPQMVMASTANKLTNMRRILFKDFKETDGCAAISNSSGVLIEAEDSFIAKLAKEFQNWHGSIIPNILINGINEGKNYLYRGNFIKICSVPISNDYMLIAMPLSSLDCLSRREYEVLKLYIDGYTNVEIAIKLFISESTVRTHISNIYYKLNLEKNSKAQLCKIWNEANKYGRWDDK